MSKIKVTIQDDAPVKKATANSAGQLQKEQVGQSVGEMGDLKVADEIAKREGDEYWLSYGHELETEKEMEELGIDRVESGEVRVPQDLAREMGIKPQAVAETPIHHAIPEFAVRGKVLTDDQLAEGKKAPVSKSFRWLAEWFIYELLKAGYLVKFFRGSVVRDKQLP